MHGGKPWMTEFDNQFVQAAGRAIEKGFGQTPVFNREGGSIPVVATFQEILGLPSVLFGVGLPDENAHAPNEKLDLGNFHGGHHRVGVPVRRGRQDQRLTCRVRFCPIVRYLKYGTTDERPRAGGLCRASVGANSSYLHDQS